MKMTPLMICVLAATVCFIFAVETIGAALGVPDDAHRIIDSLTVLTGLASVISIGHANGNSSH